MKKLLSMLLMMVLLCAACALADGELCGLLEVVNCKEWVSLRAQASTEAERLAQVPLGAIVRDGMRVSDEFWRVNYNGSTGYILAKYLQVIIDEPLQEGQAGAIPYQELLGGGDIVLRYDEDPSVCVIATMDYSDGECLRVGCYRKDHTPVWGYTTVAREVYELAQVDVFMAGSAEYPMVMVYNRGVGLTALNLWDGTMDWQLTPAQCSLGAGICHAVGQDGSIYIAGFYGPDPVCISMNGEVQWQTTAGDDNVYWPYRLTVKDGCIVTCYDSCPEEGAHYEVTYGLDGALLNTAVSHEQHA